MSEDFRTNCPICDSITHLGNIKEWNAAIRRETVERCVEAIIDAEGQRYGKPWEPNDRIIGRKEGIASALDAIRPIAEGQEAGG